jgi:uncharacterized protein YjiS (DUF1127 family)
VATRHRAALHDLVDAKAWLHAVVSEWRSRSRSRRELARLDDRMLADIGITRGEAEFLSHKPFWKE